MKPRSSRFGPGGPSYVGGILADAPASILPLIAALGALVGWLGDAKVPGIVIGGVAASLLGRPRATRDVGAVMWLEDERGLAGLLEAAKSHDLLPRTEDPIGFAMQSRVLLLRHEPSAIHLDVALGGLPFEQEAIARSTRLLVGGLLVPLPQPEDLVIMKAVAQRPRDFADIEGIVAATPSLDVNYILGWVRDFAEALETQELPSEIERLLRPHQRGSR
jgi:hypothetical protein